MKVSQTILEAFRTGQTPKQVIEQGFNKNTVYKYWKLYETYKELEQKLWGIIYNA